jgi:uncharacterized protein HemY
VFTGFNSPEVQYHYLAFDAALILVVIVMLLLVASRIIVSRTQRHSESSRATGVGRRRRRRRPDANEPLLGITGAPRAERRASGGSAPSTPP